MATDVSRYLSLLSRVALQNIGNPIHVSWNELLPLVTPNIPIAAHAKSELLTQLLWEIGITPIIRPVKSYERFLAKASIKRPDATFKALSDMLACRIIIQEPSKIMGTVNTIKDLVESAGGVCHLRNSIIDTNGTPIDIVAYLFVFLPNIGHIAELQIGHSFAAYTFEMDSLIRDQKTNADVFDFWITPPEGGSSCFYVEMRSKILNGTMDNVEKLWSKFYPTTEYPGTLKHMFP
jgi:hypothetical protein